MKSLLLENIVPTSGILIIVYISSNDNMCILDCPSPWYYISIWHSPQHRKKLNTYHRMNNLLFAESGNTTFQVLFRLNLGYSDSKFLKSLPQFANIWRIGQKPLDPPASPLPTLDNPGYCSYYKYLIDWLNAFISVSSLRVIPCSPRLWRGTEATRPYSHRLKLKYSPLDYSALKFFVQWIK